MTNPFTESPDEGTAPKEGESQNNGNPFADQLNKITNEDGTPKYSSPEAALEALPHAQTHIKSLEADNKKAREEIERMRAELEKSKSVEDFVTELTSRNPEQSPKTPESTTGLDEAKVLELVAAKLQEVQTQSTVAENLQQLYSGVTETFGDKASTVIADKAKELGTTPAKLEELGKSNPKMVLALLGSGGSSPSTNPATTSQRPPAGMEDKGPYKPEKSLMVGASQDTLKDAWKAVQSEIHKKLNVET